MSVGQGSITFSNPPGAGGISVTGARNGLSVDASGYIILGQAIGAAGDPAALIMDTEIDNAGFYLNFRGSGALVLSDAAYSGLSGDMLSLQTTTRAGISFEYNAAGTVTAFIALRNGLPVFDIATAPLATLVEIFDPVTEDAVINFAAQDNYIGGGVQQRVSMQIAPMWNITQGATNMVVAYQDLSTMASTAGTTRFISFLSQLFCETSNATDTYVGFEFNPDPVMTGPVYVAWQNSVGNMYIGTQSGTAATRVSIRNGTTATAWLQLGAGQAAASSAPLKFGNGTLQTTPELGAFEFAGNQIYFTLTAGTRSQILTGLSGAAPPATNIGVTIANYYGSSATNFLGTPVSWAAVVIAGTTYKLPLYT